MKKRKLKKLVLTNCKLVTDEGIHSMISVGTMRHLESLVLKSCVQLTDVCLFAIASTSTIGGLHSLSTLVLSGVANITDSGVVAVVRHCKTLLRLDLGSCHRVTPMALELLPQIVPLSQVPQQRGRRGLEPRGPSVRDCLSRLMQETRAARRVQRKVSKLF